MDERVVLGIWAWIALAALTFVVLFFVSAPYGRHARGGWGPMVNARAGWLIMELPSALLFPAVTLAMTPSLWPLVFCALWLAHYGYRGVIYPLRQPKDTRMPLSVSLMGTSFNLVNASVNAYAVALTRYAADWWRDPRFVVGVALFFTGRAIHMRADRALLALKAEGRGYQIPRGGLYEAISCPNYFGEMVEWLGWALATWNLAGLSFFLWTVANLLPRARAHHRWYREKFVDYPKSRRAVIPGVY